MAGLVALFFVVGGDLTAEEKYVGRELTVDTAFPEIRENASRAVCFSLEGRPLNDRPRDTWGWEQMTRWIEGLKPISLPDPSNGYVEVCPVSDALKFVTVHSPDLGSAGRSWENGAREVFRIERQRTERIQTWNRGRELSFSQIGVAKSASVFDEEGRRIEFFTYRANGMEKQWEVVSKEKFTYWPGTNELRSVSHFGYPESYHEDRPWRVEEIPKKPGVPPDPPSASP
jgi:hypothetical protein